MSFAILLLGVEFVSLEGMPSLEKTVISHAFFAWNEFIKNATVFIEE